MFSRLAMCLGLWMLGLAPVFAAPAAAPVAAPAPGQRIVAIGDLHGDFNAWRAIAQAAGLIDARGHWAGGTTIFVQTGDVPDRGPDTLKIINDLQRLQKEAPKAGGQTYTLVGNHEAMNLTGDLRYVSPQEYAAFVTAASAKLRDTTFVANQQSIEDAYRSQGNPDMPAMQIREAWYKSHPLGRIEHQAAWGPKGRIGKWVVENPAVLQLGDTIFVHGGLSGAHAGKPIAHINRAVRSELLDRNTAPDAMINEANGPLWYRGLTRKPGEAPDAEAGTTTPPHGSVEAELDHVLKTYGANRMVIGHTPQLAGIAQRQNDRLVIIDTGISAYYGGKLSWLEIIDGKLMAHETPRPVAAAAATSDATQAATTAGADSQ